MNYVKKIRAACERSERALAAAKGILDKAEQEKRGLTPTERNSFDAHKDESRKAFAERDRLKVEQERDRAEAARTAVPIDGGTFSGTRNAPPPEHRLIDPRTGNELRTFGPQDSVADHYRDHGEQINVRLGQYLYACAFGPRNEAEKRALSVGTDSAGGFGVPRPLWGQIMDALRPLSRVLSAGATLLPMTSKTQRVASIQSDPVAAWRAEAAPIAEDDAVFGGLDLDAESLAVYSKVSRELAQDAPNLDAALERSFLGAMATALDKAFLEGTGAANQPLGLKGIVGLTQIDNGNAALTWDNLIALQASLYGANSWSDLGNVILAPVDWQSLVGAKDTAGQYVVPTTFIKGLSLLPTSSIATAPATAYAGDWSQFVIGMREDANVRLLVERFADSGQIGIVAHVRADCGAVHPAALARIINVGAAA